MPKPEVPQHQAPAEPMCVDDDADKLEVDAKDDEGAAGKASKQIQGSSVDLSSLQHPDMAKLVDLQYNEDTHKWFLANLLTGELAYSVSTNST